jgi:wyosine [tRNA(Phe)-imidazoG37] synthetase (radical SAM superfamily)
MDSFVYGPISSRRFGASLGINILGTEKVCSFDCPYCDLGRSQVRLNQIKRNEIVLPSVEDLDQKIRLGLREVLNKGTPFTTITISGNGEPTLHPHFPEVVAMLLKMRDEMANGIPIQILSNGAHLDSKRVVQALNSLDQRVMKLDAGNDRAFKSINLPLVRTNITKVYSNYRKLSDIILQSFFVTGSTDNTKAEDIEDWMEIVGIIQPKLVQICTINRPPSDATVRAVDEDTLYTIASKLKRRTQIESAVFI